MLNGTPLPPPPPPKKNLVIHFESLCHFQAIDEEDEEEEEIRMKIDTDPQVIDIEETVRDEIMEQRKLDKLK